MGQTARTTKLLLDLSARDQGGANAGKRSHLEETAKILDAARQFYLDVFLAHPEKLMERVEVLSKKTGEVSERLISADKLLTWAEFHTVATAEHPDPACRFLHRGLGDWKQLGCLVSLASSRNAAISGAW